MSDAPQIPRAAELGKKWSLHRQPRELLGIGGCEYSIWLDDHIVIMADPAFGNDHIIALETVIRICNAHADLVKALSALRNEIKGCLGSYDHELRQAMGNTNVAVLHDRIANAEIALAAAGVKP